MAFLQLGIRRISASYTETVVHLFSPNNRVDISPDYLLYNKTNVASGKLKEVRRCEPLVRKIKKVSKLIIKTFFKFSGR